MPCGSCGGGQKPNTEYEATIRATGEKSRYATLTDLQVDMNRRQITGYTFRLVPKK